ncbi:ANTAR domain-containing response regulator [Streptomyces sp. NPDC005244]|uniref:ANTAR domain-containing response regulator n=1 Tax=Streptomyces sp. NPDC005244 TaxID=3364708 RepID=UPI0036A3CAEE
MSTPMPQQRLAHAFVELAGHGVTEPDDPSGLLATLATIGPRLLGSHGATVIHVPDDHLPVQLAGTDPDLVDLEWEAVEWGEGPGHDARRTGRPVPDSLLDAPQAQQAWPRYAPRAVQLGCRRAVALPLSAGPGRGLTLGALVLLYTGPDPLTDEVLALARAFADAAGYTLARDREIRQSRALADQLGHALKSRVVIEQAKGVLAARRKVSVDEAFAVLRAHARSQQRRLAEVARDVVDGRLDLGTD